MPNEVLWRGQWVPESQLPAEAYRVVEVQEEDDEGQTSTSKRRELMPDLQVRPDAAERQAQAAKWERRIPPDVQQVLATWQSFSENWAKSGQGPVPEARRVELLVKPLQQLALRAREFDLDPAKLGIPPSIAAGPFPTPAAANAGGPFPTPAAATPAAGATPGGAPAGAGTNTWPIKGNDYTAMQRQFKKEFGRDITQDEMNSGKFLASLSNAVVRLIPTDRLLTDPDLRGELGKNNSRLAQLPNEDLQGLIRVNWRIAGYLGPQRLAQMDRNFLFNELAPTMEKEGETEAWDNIRAASDAALSADTPGAGIPGNPEAGVARWETPRLKLPQVDTNTSDITRIFQDYTGTGAARKGSTFKVLSAPEDENDVGVTGPSPTGGRPPKPTDDPGEGYFWRWNPAAGHFGEGAWEAVADRSYRPPSAGRQPRDASQVALDEARIKQIEDEAERWRLTYAAAQAKGDQAAMAQAKQLELQYAQLAEQNRASTAALEAQTKAQEAQTGLQKGIATGYLDGGPTLAREAQVTGTERANLELLANLGNQAAQLKLADLNRQESIRQFDVTREDARRRDPASVFDKVWGTRMPSAAAAPAAPGVQAFQSPAPAPSAASSFRVLSTPGGAGSGGGGGSGTLSYGDIRAAGAEPPAVAAATGGFAMPSYRPAGGVPIISDQAYGQLNPTEREVFGAELLATGNNPEDYFAYKRRLQGPARRSGGGFTAPRPVGAAL